MTMAKNFSSGVGGALGLLQVLAQLGIGGGIGDHRGYRRACLEQLPLAAGELAVVTEAAATVEQAAQQQGNKQAKNAVECPGA